MPQATIENPIINSPYDEPARHFRFSDEGITNEIAEGRRVSSYFVPIAQPKKKGAQKSFDTEWTQDRVKENDGANPGLPRAAFKMATGTGKTVVMAMIIAWHTLNKRANPQDARFSDTFLIVTPGITIRDRLRVLFPNDPQSYYRQRDVLSAQDMELLGQAKIVITNFLGLQEVYGVPFSFIPCSGGSVDPKPAPTATRVRALENRIACEIRFPRLLGYRYDVAGERLTATFTEDSRLALSTAYLPTKTEIAPIVGDSSFHSLDDLRRKRVNEVAFTLAKQTLETYFRDDDGNDKPWLFPQLLQIATRWMDECVALKDNAFPQLLLLGSYLHDGADRIYRAIVASTDGTATLKPILRPYDTLGSTRYVDFDTTRPVFATREDKCHISHVVADTDSWEQKLAQTIEEMPEVVRYVKNHNLGFMVPYVLNGEEKNYIPDFIICLDDGHGRDDLLHLLLEVAGEKKKEKAAKVATARTLWVPAVNNHGGFGRWAFLEVADPWDAQNLIRSQTPPC